MRVLITRPEPDALKLKGLIEARGHETVVEPLLAVSYEDCETVDLEGVTTLIATSRNALRALRHADLLDEARHLPVFAVGAATADEARRLGFHRVIKGPGVASALSPLIASTLDPAEAMLLHLAGDRIAVDIARELEEQGFRASRAVVYRMQAAPALTDATREALVAGDIEGVLLMSAETAAVWTRLIVRHGLADVACEIPHLCLSDAIANRLKSLGEVPIEVAEQPTLEEMLALIDLAAAQLDF